MIAFIFFTLGCGGGAGGRRRPVPL